MVRVGSDDKPLLQHRRDVIVDEMNPALHPDSLADRRRLHRPVGQESEDPFAPLSNTDIRCKPNHTHRHVAGDEFDADGLVFMMSFIVETGVG